MHQATIGLFGHHIVPATIHRIKTTLRNESYTKGFTRDGKPRYLISEAMLDAVFTRLCQWLQEFNSIYAGFQLTPKYTAHVRHVYIDGKSAFTAGRLEMLMMALIFMLRNLIRPEIELIEQAIKDGRVDRDADGDLPQPPVDPCPDMIKAHACFLDWYMMARLLKFPT